MIHRSKVSNVLAVDMRLDHLGEVILLVDILGPASQHERHPHRARDVNRVERRLLWTHSTEKSEVLARRPRALVSGEVDAVVNDAGVWTTLGGKGRGLVVADRDDRNLRIPPQYPLIVHG